MTKRFPFPHPVNETSARVVATGVVGLGLAYAASGSAWLLVPLVYGFFMRVTTGPTFSPLGLIATKVVAPRLNVKHHFVPGPPKRFAQFIGLVFSVTAAVLWMMDLSVASRIVTTVLVVAAALESLFALCLGCIVFSWLMRLGVIPKNVCEECNNLHFGNSVNA